MGAVCGADDSAADDISVSESPDDVSLEINENDCSAQSQDTDNAEITQNASYLEYTNHASKEESCKEFSESGMIKISGSQANQYDGNNVIWNIDDSNVNNPASQMLITPNLVYDNSDDSFKESDDDINFENPICDLIINTNNKQDKGALLEDYEILALGSSESSFNDETRILEAGNEPVSSFLVTEILTDYETNTASNKLSNTNSDPYCDLEITMMVNSKSVNVSGLVAWMITVVNHGPNIAENVVVTDTLPKELSLVRFNKTRGTFSNGIWNIGDLEVDVPVYLVLVTQSVEDGNFTNMASVSTSTHDVNESNNKANESVEINPVCDLEIIKIVSSEKAYAGDEITWTIKVNNLGQSDALNVKVSEDLPLALKLIDVSASKGTYDKKTNAWTIDRVKRESSEILVITTKVMKSGYIINSVEVTTTTQDSNQFNNKAKATVEALACADLAVHKYCDKLDYSVNDEICWTINVINFGPCDAYDVVASDVLPSNVQFVSYNASKGVYDAASGKWTIGEMAFGESVTLDIYCIALNGGITTNEVFVSCNVTDSNLDNNHDNCTVEIKGNETSDPQNQVTDVTMKTTANPLITVFMVILIMFGSFWFQNKKE